MIPGRVACAWEIVLRRLAGVRRSGREARRGFLLAAVLLLLCVLFLLVFTRHFFSQHQMLLVDHLADQERAYQVAVGGNEVGRALLARTLAYLDDPDPALSPKRAHAPADLKAMVEKLLDDRDQLRDEDVTIAVDAGVLRDLSARHRDTKAAVVTIEFVRGTPLTRVTSNAMIVADPAERHWQMLVKADATVGVATARVWHVREARRVNILPPILGKFACFVRSPAGREFNCLRASSDRSRINGAPVVIKAGSGCALAGLAVDETQRFLDAQGWVYLGGDLRWRLGLARFGNGDGVSDGQLDGRHFYYDLAATDPLASRGRFRYYACKTPLYEELRGLAMNEVLVQKRDDEVAMTSLLHLAGDARVVTPTVVLGNVARRYALVQGLRNEATQVFAPFPCLDAATFGGDAWPGGMSTAAAQTIRSNFFGDHAQYSVRMSEVVEEPYNAGNLEIVRWGSAEVERAARVDVTQLPAGVKAPAPLQRVEIDGAPVAWHRPAYGLACTIKDDRGAVRYRIPDLAALQDLSFLDAKVCTRYDDGATFLRSVARDSARRIRIGGVVRLAGDLDLLEPLEIAPGGGGIILVDRHVRVRARVTVPEHEPVTVVALQGNVVLQTAEPVGLGLVALAGRLELPDAFSIDGLVAARELAVGLGRPGVAREIRYRSAFDPTDAANYQRSYRFVEAERGVTFVP